MSSISNNQSQIQTMMELGLIPETSAAPATEVAGVKDSTEVAKSATVDSAAEVVPATDAAGVVGGIVTEFLRLSFSSVEEAGAWLYERLATVSGIDQLPILEGKSFQVSLALLTAIGPAIGISIAGEEDFIEAMQGIAARGTHELLQQTETEAEPEPVTAMEAAMAKAKGSKKAGAKRPTYRLKPEVEARMLAEAAAD